MNPARLREVLDRVAEGALSTDAALEQLRGLPFEDLGFAKVDHHRDLRCGLPEVIFAPGKDASQIVAIARRLREQSGAVLITRLAEEVAAQVVEAMPDLTYERLARLASWRGAGNAPDASVRGIVVVAAAGTADLPVAEEAALTAEWLGNPVERVYDVGVAGLHRLLAHREKLRSARVLIVVAGMEGALPSVVGGLIDKPLIAVPTSVGYGASFAGLAALLAMLNSCAAGVTAVNIDNGFGAAVAANLINRS
jgi:NCAIR mutase (PurE)-related protein